MIFIKPKFVFSAGIFIFVVVSILYTGFRIDAPVIAQTTVSNVPNPNVSLNPPKMLLRKDWKAKDAIKEMKPHKIRFITIHHTAVLQKPEFPLEKKMQNLQSFSQNANKLASGKEKPAWADVPYHFYIAANGQIAEGREINFAGDSNTDYDTTGHALIVLEGNFQTEKVSAEQEKSLEAMVFWLADLYKVSPSEVKGHNDYASTGCPGVNLKNMLPSIRAKLSSVR